MKQKYPGIPIRNFGSYLYNESSSLLKFMINRYPIGLFLKSILFVHLTFALSAQKITDSKTENWHGFQKVSFLLDGTPAYYVKPHKPMTGNPWVWRASFPDWHISMDSILLEKGFHIAFLNVDNRYGDSQSMLKWDNFYNYLTQSLSFAPKVALEGISRGGLYVYAWAKRNPEKVSCIYAETPVCDFKSWPGGKGKSKRSEKEWQQLLEIYGFTEEQALAYDDNPIDHLEGLAAYKVPVLHIIGLKDKLTPPDENTFLLVDRYQKLGGPAYVYSMSRGPQTLEGHHFPIEHPEWWADFIIQYSTPVIKTLPKSDYVQLRAGLPQFYKALIEKQTITVAFLGGSITHNSGWRDKISKYLKERFPKNTFTFINAGIPSLGSLPHAFRFEQDVVKKGRPDILFLESAVNDYTNETDSLTQIRALEGIVRHAKNSNPAMDIILMSFADPDKTASYRKGLLPLEIRNHEAVASHYQLPSINLSKEVADRLQANEFSWEYDFKDLHPSPFGQEIYYQTIKYLINESYKNIMADNKVSTISTQLPASLVPKNFEGGKYVSINQARIKTGWQLIENWQPADGISTRQGFVNCPVLEASTPEAELSLTFKGNAVGIGLVSGPDAGEVLYSIDKGPFKKMDLYTQWSHFLHLPWYVLFAANLSDKEHTLHLKVSKSNNPKSKGNACRIVYFLVNSTEK